MNTKNNLKFAQVRAQLGVKATNPSFDLHSDIAQAWENTQNEINIELNSFDELWESHTLQDDLRSNVQIETSKLFQNEQNKELNSDEKTKSSSNDSSVNSPTNKTDENNKNVDEQIEKSQLSNLISDDFSSENFINDYFSGSQEKEAKNSVEESSVTLEQSEDEAEKNPSVFSLLQEVTEQLADNLEQTNNSEDKSATGDESSSSVPSLLTTETKTETKSDETTKTKGKESKTSFIKGFGAFFILSKILLVVLAYYVVTVVPTNQINKQIRNMSELTINLKNVNRNYRSGVTTIDSITAFDSQNKLIYQTGKATFSGLPLLATKQLHLDSVWIEDIEFIPQKKKVACNDIKVENTFTVAVQADDYNSDVVIAEGDTSEYLFAESTNAFLAQFLKNLELFSLWLPDDIGQCLKNTNSINPSTMASKKDKLEVSIEKLHLSGNTVFMGKPTIFALDIDNYSSHPTGKPMTIELAFGANRSGKLFIEVMRRENGSELKIHCSNTETNNRFAFGSGEGLRVFQNDPKAKNSLSNREITMTVSRGRIQGELKMTQKVAKANIVLHGINNPSDVEKLQSLAVNIDTIAVNDKFEGIYSKPVHHIESNLDSIGQASIEIAKNSYHEPVIENPLPVDTQSVNTQTAIATVDEVSPNDNLPTDMAEPENILPEVPLEPTEQIVEQNSTPTIMNDMNSEPAPEVTLPVLVGQTEETVPQMESAQNILLEEHMNLEEESDQSNENDVELVISENQSVPLTAPNSPAIGSNAENNATRPAGKHPPLPIFVDEEEDKDNDIQEETQDKPAVRFILKGRSSKTSLPPALPQ